MTHEQEQLPEPMRNAARDYNSPPELTHADLDAMWSDIERASFTKPFSTPSADRKVSWRDRSALGGWLSTRNLVPLAAVLLLGIAIGRFTRPVKTAGLTVAARPSSPDSVAVPEPYQNTTSQYLGQTAALLVALPAEVKEGRADDRFLGRAHDLLLTTRLLLDTPAATDPRFRTLLEDLELVLVQVVRLQSDQGGGHAELDLIRQALEQRDVLPRLRNAAADISADD